VVIGEAVGFRPGRGAAQLDLGGDFIYFISIGAAFPEQHLKYSACKSNI